MLLTSADYIPVDSSHELTMADALIAAHRDFVKPLHYDRDEATLPDFVLTDSPNSTATDSDGHHRSETVIEVWGVTGSTAYEQRKHAKLARYRAEGVPVIEWTPPEPLPPLDLES